jgi:two-component system OmpR family response regulator/two-component system response regulator QseB
MRILVVEDDPLLGDALNVGLRQRGFDVDWVHDGAAAELALRTEPFAAAVLDLGLPRLDGIEVLRRERARGSRTPVLVLTARDAIEARVRGLDSGADDYVVKPVDLDELAARLRALVRRSRGEPAAVLAIGPLRLDPAARSVAFRGEPVVLQER